MVFSYFSRNEDFGEAHQKSHFLPILAIWTRYQTNPHPVKLKKCHLISEIWVFFGQALISDCPRIYTFLCKGRWIQGPCCSSPIMPRLNIWAKTTFWGQRRSPLRQDVPGKSTNLNPALEFIGNKTIQFGQLACSWYCVLHPDFE